MSRECQELTFPTHDGVDLVYRHWPAMEPANGAIVLLHRGHEHGGRMTHVVDELDLPNFHFFAWDARGHGLSPGQRGHSPSFAHSVRDLETFTRNIENHHAISREDTAVIAQSVGAVIAATWVHDYAPPIRALVLAAPAFSVKLYVPLARPGLALMRRLRGPFDVNSYVKAKFLTHDPERQASYDSDPLISRAISVDILLQLYEAADRVVADAAAITVPTQVLVAGSDFVVRHDPQYSFHEQLGTPIKECHTYPGLYHDILGEAERAPVIADMRRFLVDRFDQPRASVDLIPADKAGFTKDEADRLSAPLPALSPKGIWWAAYRANLKLGGKFSSGIALGHRTGFDSGSTLDYVYRNQPEGRLGVGKLMDRAYLDAIGWKGIRQRKRNVEELIRLALARLQETDLPANVVDIAAGHGRYVLDALSEVKGDVDSIVLRDYSDINVEAGGKLIAEMGLSDIARFEHGDAFSGESLAGISPAPTLAIVSGLYELFPDNAMVGQSLKGLAAGMPEGGYLVYTGQPWHPQLEMIARALTSHRAGQAWVMRRRSQAELDQLVAAAGYRKLEQRIDQWGIFTVSLAVREAGSK